MKRKIIDWFKISKVWIFISLILSIALILTVIGLADENARLEEDNIRLKEEVKVKQDMIFERNNELYICNMEKDEWRELFYTEIDFHPYEGPDW